MENNGIKRDDKGRIVAGSKAINAGGRPKNIAAKVKEMSNDYMDYLEMLDTWARDTTINIKIRKDCIVELLDRSLGKALQRNEIGGLDIVVGLPKDIVIDEG
jgi:hypothetical protein